MSSPSRAFAPGPQLLSQVPRTRDIDTLLGIMLTTNPAVPLRRKYDVAVRMKGYLPMYVYGSLLRIAMAVAGKEAVEAELAPGTDGSGEAVRGLGLARRILRDLYRRIAENLERLREASPELGLKSPPALDDTWFDGKSLPDLVDALSEAISDYYISEVAKWEKALDMLMFAYASGVLAAAIIDPIRALESKLS